MLIVFYSDVDISDLICNMLTRFKQIVGNRLPVAIVTSAALIGNWSCAGTGVTRTNLEETDCASPTVVAVMIDQTKSMRATSTAMPSVEDFDSLVEKLRTCGGELKVTFVRNRPDQGSIRLRFPDPPSVPDKPVQGADEENFEFDDRMAAYGRQLIERRNEIAMSRKDMEPVVQNFRSELRDRLKRPLTNKTDFNSALNDAEVFLATDGDWRNHPAKYLIINSDALDEKQKPRLGIRIDPDIFWINTSTNDKALSGHRFTRCDSFASAVRQIISR